MRRSRPMPTQGALLAQHAGYRCLPRAGRLQGRPRPRQWLTAWTSAADSSTEARGIPRCCLQIRGDSCRRCGQGLEDDQANHFPVFKSRRRHRRAFRADNGPDTVRCVGNRIQLAKIGAVKMREDLRFEGSIREVRLFRTLDVGSRASRSRPQTCRCRSPRRSASAWMWA